MRRRRRYSRDPETEIAAWRDATNETAPWHLWKHAVEYAAVRKGASSEFLKGERARKIMHRAYSHGEPVWMVVEELVLVSKARPAPSPREEIRSAVAAYYTRRRDRCRRHR